MRPGLSRVLSRHQVLNTMSEQRRKLDLLCVHDSIEEHNRIVRHISDFTLMLCKALCEHAGKQVGFLLSDLTIAVDALSI